MVHPNLLCQVFLLLLFFPPSLKAMVKENFLLPAQMFGIIQTFAVCVEHHPKYLNRGQPNQNVEVIKISLNSIHVE